MTKLQMIAKLASQHVLPAGFAIVGREDGTPWTVIELQRNGVVVVISSAKIKRQLAQSVTNLAADAVRLNAS